MLYSRKLTTEKGRHGKSITLYESRRIVSRWLLFEAPKVPIQDPGLITELHEDAWKRVKQVGFALAFPLDEKGRLNTEINDSSRLFVYFPTEERSGLRYRIHADFFVDSSRKSIDHQRPYNCWLAEQIASYLAHKVVPELVRRFPDDERVVDILAPISEPLDISAVINSSILKALPESVFIPTHNGKYSSPKQILLVPKPIWGELDLFRRFFPYDDLSRLYSKKFFLHESLYRKTQVVEFIIKLGGEFLSVSSTFALLDGRDPTGGQGDFPKFYGLLQTWYENLIEEAGEKETLSSGQLEYRKSQFMNSLSQTFCIYESNKRWIKPHTRIYHPKFRQETADMPAFLSVQIVNSSVYGEKGRTSAAFNILNRLVPPVREYDAPEIIVNSIMPFFEKDKFQDLSVSDRVQIYRYLFDYWRTSRGGDRIVNDVIGNVKVLARPIADRTQQVWKKIQDVYLSSDWTKDNKLERIYEGFENIYFLYSIRGINLDENDRSKWNEFLQWMGARIIPRLQEHHENYYSWRSLNKKHPHGGTSLWTRYLDFVEENFGTCPRHGSSKRTLKHSVTLEALDRVIEAQEPVRLEALFELLAENWNALKVTFQDKARVTCQGNGYCLVSDKEKYVPTFVKFLLTKSKWMPARNIENGVITATLLEPSKCWFVSSSEDPIVRNMLPSPLIDIDASNTNYQNFCQDLGMHFLQNAGLKDLTQILRELPDRFPDPSLTIYIGRRPYPRAVRTLTRWVFERVNNYLSQYDQSPLLQSERFPLVADLGDIILYVPPEKSIFFADDRIYAPRWKRDVPFAPLDDDWRDVADYLGIYWISKNVTERVLPGDNLTEKSSTLMRRFTNARPYILAVIDSHRAAKTDDNARYLMNLDIQVVDSLVVERSLKVSPSLTIMDDKAFVFLQERVLERIGSAGRAPRAGTLYIQDGHQENFDRMGGPIANYLGMTNLSDAFVILLDRGSKDGRMQYLQMQNISEEVVEEMRKRLGQPDEPPTVEIKVILPPQPKPEENPTPGDTDKTPIAPEPPSPTSPPTGGNPPTGGDDEPGQDNKRYIKFPSLNLENLTPEIITDGEIIKRVSTGGGGGGGGSIDWERDFYLKQALGERGEEVVYNQELVRLRNLGRENPEQHVRWLRKLNQTAADHDIESEDLINGNWVTIYIEVKSTSGRDFRFEMSSGELNFADQQGDRYQLHRVIEVATARPRVFVFSNPMTLYRQGKALIDMHDTYVTLPDPFRQGNSGSSAPKK